MISIGIQNLTANTIYIKELQVKILGDRTRFLDPYDFITLADSRSLIDEITAGNVVLVRDNIQLSQADSLSYLADPSESSVLRYRTINFVQDATLTTILFKDHTSGDILSTEPINAIQAVAYGTNIRIQRTGGEQILIDGLDMASTYINGVLVTAVLVTAVLELNTLFANAGGLVGNLPVITSSNTILLTAGSNINYTVTGTNLVSVDFDLSTTGTVPVGAITQTNFERRKIIGGSTLAAGSYTIVVTAYNYFGQVSLTVTLTVSSAFTNTYSLYSNTLNLTSRLIANFDNSPTYRLNDATTTPWTVICWFKNIYTWATADICRHNYNFYGGALYIGSTSTTITMTYGDATDYLSASANSGGVADLDWHMVAVTYDGTTTDAGASSYGAFKFYFDSVLIAAPTWTAGGTGWSGAISGAVNYKGFQIATVKYGYRDEFATYPKEMNQADITSIYNAGTPIDLNTFVPTTSGATTPSNYYRFGDGNSGATTDITGYPTMYNMGSLGSGADMTNGGGTVADIVSSVP